MCIYINTNNHKHTHSLLLCGALFSESVCVKLRWCKKKKGKCLWRLRWWQMVWRQIRLGVRISATSSLFTYAYCTSLCCGTCYCVSAVINAICLSLCANVWLSITHTRSSLLSYASRLMSFRKSALYYQVQSLIIVTLLLPGRITVQSLLWNFTKCFTLCP